MPYLDDFPHPCRYNTLRLLGYDYTSINRLCAITLVTDLRRSVFGDIKLAKAVLACLLSDQILAQMRLRAFTLMPNHLHLVAGVRLPETDLSRIIANFKSYTTQLYWRRCTEIVRSKEIILPSTSVSPSSIKESQPLISALMDWRATVRPEVVNLKNWPSVKPEHFLRKRLWQTRLFDHVIRNEFDLRENLDYLAMNPVREGYVAQPQFCPFSGFYCQ